MPPIRTRRTKRIWEREVENNNNKASAAAANTEIFIYTVQSREDIPRNLTRIKVDPAVKVIGSGAFSECRQLMNVELCEGLKRINESAFQGCNSLERIIIPSTVKEIGSNAFYICHQLMNVELCEGLEIIEQAAFEECVSLERIIIPSTVKLIGSWAFYGCSQLINMELNEGLQRIDNTAFARCTSLLQVSIPSTVHYIAESAFSGCEQLMTVDLSEGLEDIDRLAFECCISLQRIRIPSTVKEIGKDAFHGCTSLVSIEFCFEMEQFVNEASLPWWNHGVSETSLRTFSFLAWWNIPAHFSRIKVQTWRDNIHNMLQCIPTMITLRKAWENEEDEDDYFDDIKSQLSNYKQLQDDIALILELALWKTKMEELSNGNRLDEHLKLQCRLDSLAMVPIIIPIALSFL